MLNECCNKCIKESKPCENTICRHWLDFKEDLNCTLIAVENNDDKPMTLHETGKRLNMSHVNILKIEKRALDKINLKLEPDIQYD